MQNESEMELPYQAIQNLLKKSENSSLNSRKDALAMVIMLNNDEYSSLTLTPTEHLYCNLLRIKEQKSRSLLSESENADITELYRKTFYLLWKEWEKHEESQDCYNSINLLSEALYEANKALADEEKIKPTFSNVIFTSKQDFVPPGNFAYFYLNNVTFSHFSFIEWGNRELEGSVIQACFFDENTYCRTENFEKAQRIDDCTFATMFSELDELESRLTKNDTTLANRCLIEIMMDHKQAIKKLKGKLAKLKQHNATLENQLRQTTPETNTSCFFQSVKREFPQEQENHLAPENKKFHAA